MKSKKVSKVELKGMLDKMQKSEMQNGKSMPIGMSEPKRGMKKIANKKAKKA